MEVSFKGRDIPETSQVRVGLEKGAEKYPKEEVVEGTETGFQVQRVRYLWGADRSHI